MNAKNSLIWVKLFLVSLFVSLAAFLSFNGFVNAQEEGAEVEEVEPTAPAPAPASQAPSVLAATDGDFPDIRVEVSELKRTSGDTVTLKFKMINDSSEPLNFSYDFAEEGRYETIDFGSIGGAHLIDAVNKKKYFVLRDSEGKCVCSRSLKPVEPGSRANLYAKFPAPPESIEKITVIIPHFIPMDDVPISK